MSHILYQILKIILSTFKKHNEIFKKHNEKIDNPLIRIYVNKIKKIKNKKKELHLKLKQDIYYLELLTPERMKLLRSTENKITKDKNG